MNAKELAQVSNAKLGGYVWRNHARHYKGKTQAFLLSYVIAKEYYNPDFGYAWPSVKKLAEFLGKSERQVLTYISAIRGAVGDDGTPLWIIQRGHQTRTGGGIANRYFPTFTVDALNYIEEPPAQQDVFVDWRDLTPSRLVTEDAETPDTAPEPEPAYWDPETAHTLKPGAHDEFVVPSEGGLFTADTLPSSVPRTVEELNAICEFVPRKWTLLHAERAEGRSILPMARDFATMELLVRLLNYTAYCADFDGATREAGWQALRRRQASANSREQLILEVVIGALNGYLTKHPGGVKVPVADPVDIE